MSFDAAGGIIGAKPIVAPALNAVTKVSTQLP